MRTVTRVCLLRVNVQAGSAAREPRVRSFQAATVATLLVSTCWRAQARGIGKGSTEACAAMQCKK